MSDEAIEFKKILSAKEILLSEDIEIIDVYVPEWKGTVRLRAMTGEESIQYNQLVTNNTAAAKNGAAVMCAMCIVDEDGKQQFTADQATLLAKKSLSALVRLQKAALKLNGLDEDKAAVKNA